MKFDNQRSTLDEINSDKIESIVGGSTFLNSVELRNVKNYYINLLPFTSRPYLEVTDEIVKDWTSVEGCDFPTSERIIKQKARLKELKWGNLNRREKIGVLTPMAAITFVVGTAVAGEVAHLIKSKN